MPKPMFLEDLAEVALTSLQYLNKILCLFHQVISKPNALPTKVREYNTLKTYVFNSSKLLKLYFKYMRT
jgi:hypothetical protein